MSIDNNRQQSGISRRKILQSVGIATSVGLAGCAGQSDETQTEGNDTETDQSDGSDGGNGTNQAELGERVPNLKADYWTDYAALEKVFTAMFQVFQEDWKELGINIKPNGKTLATQFSEMSDDGRQVSFRIKSMSGSPSRLDPNELLRYQTIYRAGANGELNAGNYANCEYSKLVDEQSQILDREKRKSVVQDAFRVRSNDISVIPTNTRPTAGTYNKNKVTPKRMGTVGIDGSYNPYMVIASEVEGDTLTIGTSNPVAETKYFPSYPGAGTISYWSNLFYSPIYGYDENYELGPILADSVETSDDGTTITVELMDGAKFHSGDPITSEDVAFTFNFIEKNPGAHPYALNPTFETSIVDDKTVEFSTDEPFPGLLTVIFPRWGILPKKDWVEAGATESPGQNYPEDVNGSGPWKLTDFQEARFVAGEPFRDHPVYSPDHNLVIRTINESEALYQAFAEKNLDIVPSSGTQFGTRAEENLDFAKMETASGFTNYWAVPVHPKPPTKFREFRLACGMAVNREKINQLAFNGHSENVKYAELFNGSYPSMPENPMDSELQVFTEDKAGDIEGARQVLKEAGWGWDNNGNLHYPADADLSPVWPKGEEPSSEEFPCLESQG